MNLHEHKEEFEQLIAIVADYIGVPADAVRRDYYIVQMMQNLQNSEYAEVCVFKGGTSLSKCYPGSINRFSEDIDLTFIPVEDMTNKKYSKALKRVEDTISDWFQCKTGSFFKEKHENLYSGISRRERHAGCRDRI